MVKNRPVLIKKTELKTKVKIKKIKRVNVKIGSIIEIIFNPTLTSENGQNNIVP